MKNKQIKPRSSTDFRNIIIYTFLFFVTFINIKSLWVFTIIFLFLAIFSGFSYTKHKNNEEELEAYFQEHNIPIERKNNRKKSNNIQTRDEQKYNDFLNQIEKEIPDFDDDDYYDDDDEM